MQIFSCDGNTIIFSSATNPKQKICAALAAFTQATGMMVRVEIDTSKHHPECFTTLKTPEEVECLM